MGSRPNSEKFCFIPTKCESFLVMPKKKPDNEKAKKISISIPRAIWNLAEIQMFNRREGESEYIRELIKADTHELWVQQNQIAPFLKAAETTEAGPELSQDKAKGKYQTAAQVRAQKKRENAGAKTTKLSESLGSGSSTATTANSRRAG